MTISARSTASSLFHVKQRRASNAMSRCSGAGSQRRISVSPHTLGEIWRRHIADSAQLVALFPRRGAGSISAAAPDCRDLSPQSCSSRRLEHSCTCVESNQRKCAFLRAAIRETGAPAVVQEGRIESVLKQWRDPADFISARALASFPALLDLTEPAGRPRGIGCAFHKGEDFDAELAEASRHLGARSGKTQELDRSDEFDHRSEAGGTTSGLTADLSRMPCQRLIPSRRPPCWQR